MNKIFIIAKREFLTRVKKKTFLLTTIGVPLLIIGLYALIIYFTVKNTDNFKIAIADNAQIFSNSKLDSLKTKELQFTFVNTSNKSQLDSELVKEKYNAYVYVPQNFNINNSNDTLQLVAAKSVGLLTQETIEKRISKALLKTKLTQGLKVSTTTLDSLQQPTQINFTVFNSKSKNESLKSGVSYGVGMFSGMMIYFVLFIYGSMVMRGVMEEKTNRIAEVIVSSVKPFQLMLGKIFGIGSVGLVQFLVWVILMFGLQILLPLIFPDLLTQMQAQPIQPGMMQAANSMNNDSFMSSISQIPTVINIPLIIGCFLFYFLGGYFMYASLFAAVGSTVNEDPQDAQSLMLPITMPIIFGIVILMQTVNNPTSALAKFGSIFPLTSPIVMMGRVAHGVPDGVSITELILSMIVLVASFIGTTWVAGKIYRTGILMYGKKVTWKEMLKWVFVKS